HALSDDLVVVGDDNSQHPPPLPPRRSSSEFQSLMSVASSQARESEFEGDPTPAHPACIKRVTRRTCAYQSNSSPSLAVNDTLRRSHRPNSALLSKMTYSRGHSSPRWAGRPSARRPI